MGRNLVEFIGVLGDLIGASNYSTLPEQTSIGTIWIDYRRLVVGLTPLHVSSV